jgi:hypothetical protein
LSPFYQKLALWLVFGLIFVFMWTYFNKTGQPIREIAYSDFLERVEQGLVRGIRIEGEKIMANISGWRELMVALKHICREMPISFAYCVKNMAV